MIARAEAWERLQEPCDILVIGGGVTGAAILLEAARRGLRAALIERGDFASGASSRSSKLVHGGLRYLKEGKLALMREAVREREALLCEAPELVEPMPFLLPHYRGRKPGRLGVELALTLYDALAGHRRHRSLRAAQALELEPLINERDLIGAHLFLDATTDDARLVLQLLREAEHHGGIAMNYVDAIHLLRRDDTVVGAVAIDLEGGGECSVSAKVTINATGVSADALRGELGERPKLRPLRGSHLLIAHARLPVGRAIAFSHPRDARPVFAYPWLGMTLVGTTDLDHRETLRNEPQISPEELGYLLEAVNVQFPHSGIGSGDIVSTYAGLRPVVSSGKADPSAESRDYLLLEEHGLVTITGGKLTTFRPMALAALRAAARRLDRPIDLRHMRIFEAPYAPPHTRDEALRQAARSECVVHLDDLLLRRTRVGLQLPGGGTELFAQIKTICAEELGWDDARWDAELVAYRKRWKTHYGVPA
ncbi:MAG: glycerol-3-phosphate dehydrogenase/oxidase [Vulcanimicrobiaceae bacterium]